MTAILRIAGVVDSAGDELVFTAAGPVTLMPASLKPLDALAASGGCTIPLVYGPELQSLLRRDLAFNPSSATAPVRLSRPVEVGDATIDVSSSIATGLVWIGGEVMNVTGGGPSVYNVTRAVGDLGVARAVYFDPGGDSLFPVVLARQPNPIGARAEVKLAGSVVYRGYVTAVSSSGSSVSVSVGSCLAGLRQRSADRYVALPGSGLVSIDVAALTASRVSYGTRYDVSDYVRVWCGKAWFVARSFQSGALLTSRHTGTDVLQWGVDADPYPRDVAPDALATGEPIKVTEVEPLLSFSVRSPSATVEEVLISQWPPGQAGGLALADIGDLSALDAAFGDADLVPPFSAEVGDWWWPVAAGRSIAEAVAAGICEPMGCALTADAQGRVTAIDWVRSLGAVDPVDASDLLEVNDTLNETRPLAGVEWTRRNGPGVDTISFISDYVSQVGLGGQTLKLGVGWIANAGVWLPDRVAALLALWQYPIPLTSISLAAEYNPGDLIRLSSPVLIGRDGTRGVVSIDALVIDQTRNLTEVARATTVALTGYSVDVTAGVWAPSAVVFSVSGSELTLAMDGFGPAADWFTVGTVAALLDSDGQVRDATVTVTAAAGVLITVSGLSVTPVPGDRLVLADWTQAQYPLAAYFSRGFQYV